MPFGLGLAPENAKYLPAASGEHPKVSVADNYRINFVLRRSHFARFESKKGAAWCRKLAPGPVEMCEESEVSELSPGMWWSLSP